MTSRVWVGESVAVLATGPSLTIEDVHLVYTAGFILVGVNSIWKMVPHVDILYAGDHRYWKAYIDDIEAAGIVAKRYSRSSRAEKEYDAKYVKTKLGKDYNSGELAVEFAIQRGSERVVMLGFDASVQQGLHCHGAHDKTPNPNPDRARRWLKQFDRIPKHYPNADVVNCSRRTRIKSIKRALLEDYLEGLPESPLRSARAAQRLGKGSPEGRTKTR